MKKKYWLSYQVFYGFVGIVLLFFFFLFPSLLNAQEISLDPSVVASGEKLFTANCKSCHRVDKKLIGPALAGVYDRVPSIDWIKSFVRNSSKVIAEGDDYANKIYEEYDKILMTSFTSFTDEQVMDVLAYIKFETEKPKEKVVVSGSSGGESSGNQAELIATYTYVMLIGMGLVLLLLLVVLVSITRIIKKFLTQKQLAEEEQEVLHSPYSMSSILQSSGFVFFVLFIVTFVAVKSGIDGLFSIGVQQGYQPKQPIAFSHKIHAGEYDIDCTYCHTGVMKGRIASIPSANICMNCHTQLRQGTNTGETEIAKIVAAVENNRPIEWVRVHNLPDLAYFNHSQHVNVGGTECTTCHGPIEEMDVVKQYSLLTMGWCIDCHRKTDVNTKGNNYYDKLVEMHEGGTLKVEDTGGLECAKCHY